MSYLINQQKLLKRSKSQKKGETIYKDKFSTLSFLGKRGAGTSVVRTSGFCEADERGVRQEEACLKFSQAKGNVKIVLVSVDDNIVDIKGHMMQIQFTGKSRVWQK